MTPLTIDWDDVLTRLPFLEPTLFERPDGIHGVGHATRVAAIAHVLSERTGLDGIRRDALLWAALWHDIGRIWDGRDPHHGAASVERARELELHAHMSPERQELIEFAMWHHVLSDSAAEDAALDLDHPTDALSVLWHLKDADALDRIRLGPFGMNPRFLRYEESRPLERPAKELFSRYVRG